MAVNGSKLPSHAVALPSPQTNLPHTETPPKSGVFSPRKIFSKLGPGLVTGASDDDPSGIGTYSQIGAQFGYGMLWTMVLSYPLMSAFQEICARIGRVTGHGDCKQRKTSLPPPGLRNRWFSCVRKHIQSGGRHPGHGRCCTPAFARPAGGSMES